MTLLDIFCEFNIINSKFIYTYINYLLYYHFTAYSMLKIWEIRVNRQIWRYRVYFTNQ